MNSNYIKTVLILSLTALSFTACNVFNSDTENIEWGDWARISSYEGIPRSNAVAFSIDGKGYVGTGYNGDQDDDQDRLKDIWEFDPEMNFWTQKADFPGIPRNSAVAFVADGKGYVGTGYNDDVDGYYLRDFWAYDPATNSWDSVAAFGGSARYGAVAFALNNKGYVGTGHDDNDLKDFWRYDPETDQWAQVVSIPGEKRIDATAFVIDDKAYVGTGTSNGIYEPDFWVYNPESGLWSNLQNLDEDRDENSRDIPRSKAVSFTLDGKGYIALGYSGGNKSNIWQYNPETDVWTDEDLAVFEGNARRDAVAFTINNLAYVGTGNNGSLYYDDFWEYNPNIENDEDSY
ncbi:Kelch motif-containing protein [Gracilimonas mengyeensis]|uniref:Kelch motif-containing protein n=2 Tax=Gracilimonas mengyeensis TaxID=1302730 RepID=A0A521BVB8_9BACT|nr:Kelch motif-containing protein [Gracilimonas mengyeensis]